LSAHTASTAMKVMCCVITGG